MKTALIVCVSVVLLLQLGCSWGKSPIVVDACIYPPIADNEVEKTALIETAGKLEKLKIDGNAKLNFTKVVKQNFETIPDEDKALDLFLKAIYCYLGKGKVGKEIAKEMTEIVRIRWGASKGFAGITDKLTPIEKREIRKMSNADFILAQYKGLGIE